MIWQADKPPKDDGKDRAIWCCSFCNLCSDSHEEMSEHWGYCSERHNLMRNLIKEEIK